MGIRERYNERKNEVYSSLDILLDSSKVMVDKAEFEEIKILAKKQIVYESKEKKLVEDNKKLAVKVQELQRENQSKKTELYSYKSIKNRLTLPR